MVTLPGLAVLLTVLAINLVGDALNEALNPRQKR
jgi:ABC-type dipeptide/oligopeptide/nickel transport system permease subunit